jgi:hypothetical protein
MLLIGQHMEGITIDRGSAIWTIVLAIALINQFLTAFGLTERFINKMNCIFNKMHDICCKVKDIDYNGIKQEG